MWKRKDINYKGAEMNGWISRREGRELDKKSATATATATAAAAAAAACYFTTYRTLR